MPTELKPIAPFPDGRPGPDEYAPFYRGYVDSVGDRALHLVLHDQLLAYHRALEGLPEERALLRYAEGKWSVKEVIAHVADAERIFAYRALRIARGDATPLASFDENAYAAACGADGRAIADLSHELGAVRLSTLALLRGFGPEAWERRGTASGATASVRALAFIIAGHAEHHLRLLAERYGVGVPARG